MRSIYYLMLILSSLATESFVYAPNVGFCMGEEVPPSQLNAISVSRKNRFSPQEVVGVPVKLLNINQRLSCRLASDPQRVLDENSFVYGQIVDTCATYTRVFIGYEPYSYKHPNPVYFECLFSSILGKITH